MNVSLLFAKNLHGLGEVDQASNFLNRYCLENTEDFLRLTCYMVKLFGFLSKKYRLLHYVLNCQPLVPAISAEDGEWLVARPFSPVCKPGGHGVIWKLAYDKGIYQWFYDHGRKGATVRQVRLDMSSMHVKSIIFMDCIVC